MNFRIKDIKQVVLHAQGGSGGTGYMTGAKTMSREAMQLALEALELYQSRMCVQMFDEAITALRQALEEKREPVGYFSVNDYGRWEENEGTYGEPLYTAPQKQWVGLTKEDMPDGDNPMFDTNEFYAGMAWAEAKLKDKNT
jgi:hypothetical protein